MTPVLKARRERVNRIRRRVAGGAAGLFFVSTAAIVVQMVTGHDPVLARANAARARTAASARTARSAPAPQTVAPGQGTGGPPPGSGGQDIPGGSEAPPSSGQISPMTTGQS